MVNCIAEEEAAQRQLRRDEGGTGGGAGRFTS